MELVTAVMFAPGAGQVPPGRDQIVVVPRIGLLAVADWDGSHGGGPEDGRAGARLALDLIRAHLERNDDRLDRFRRNPTPQLRQEVLEAIEEGFARAAQDVFAFSRRRKGVLITLDVLLLLEHEAFIGHIGDGRVYLVRRGLVHQLTIDHSRGDEAVQAMEPSPGRDHPADADEGRTTRALGPAAHVRVETMCIELAHGDRFVVCAAPVHRGVPEQLLHTRLSSEHLDALAQAVAADGPSTPLLGACAQLGGGEAFAADSAQARLALLAPMPLLAHLTERELRLVAQATTPRRFPADAVVFEEGDVGGEVYLLIAGEVVVSKEGSPIASLGPGSTFGEMAMLDEPGRSATVVTLVDTEMMVITRQAFFTMLRSHPLLAVKVLWNLLLGVSANLRRTNERIAELERDGRLVSSG
jgi:serine/threonine protein phosphatase PrpC